MGAFIHFAIAAADEAVYASGLVERGQKLADRYGDEVSYRIGTYISSGIGDFWAIEREHEKLLNDGPQPRLALLHPFGHRQPRRRTGLDPLRREGAELGHGHGLLRGRARHRRQLQDHPARRRRRDDLRRRRVGHHADVRGGLRRDARALDAQRRPRRASRPFERDRDGFVIGEGAGLMILEELEFARARGAKIYAEVVGYGMTADAFHITMPDETASGAVRVMTMALKDAGVEPEEVGYVNAHGTSTPYNDKFETLAIKKTFGEHAYQLAVSSTKSMTGHLLGAAGGIEAVFSVLAIHAGTLPPTINYVNPDPECDLDYVPNEPREAHLDYALSNSFGFGGTNAALLFKRYEE